MRHIPTRFCAFCLALWVLTGCSAQQGAGPEADPEGGQAIVPHSSVDTPVEEAGSKAADATSLDTERLDEGETETDPQPLPPEAYLGIGTTLLQDDLVTFQLAMTGISDAAPLAAYGRCAAAQYALIRGYGFARHLRTNVKRGRKMWRADAAYVISATRPQGLKIIVAEEVVSECRETGIPTV